MAIQPAVPAHIAQRLEGAEHAWSDGHWVLAMDQAAAEFDGLSPDNIARLLIECSDHGSARAAEIVESSPAPAPPAGDLRWRAAILLALARPIDALSRAREAVAADPDDRLALDVLARAALHRHEFDEAKSAAERLVSIAPAWPESFELLSEVREAEGKPEEARKAADRCLRLDHKRLSAWRRLGTISLAMGDSFSAVNAFCAMETIAPGLPETREKVAEALESFEASAVRRQLPLAIAMVGLTAAVAFASTRLFFLSVGFPKRLALWAAMPPASSRPAPRRAP